jgi:3-oxoacyl-[acyl-carrier protein] reductase
MERDLSNKLAVVTGGSRGIGKAISKTLCSAGAKVIITGRHRATLEEAAKELGNKVQWFCCDHSSPKSIEAFSMTVLNEHGVPNILINNAGCMKGSLVTETRLEDWNQVVDTNLTGVFLTTKAFLPGMIEKNSGDIIMISSMSGKKGDPGSAAYAASKFGLQGFSQSLMHEVRRNNIRVMVLNPSRVNTSNDTGPKMGPGLTLHANDIAETVLHLICLPARTMIRDMDIYGTNPY